MPEIKTGSTALSFTQQLLIGDPSKFVVGGKLYFFEAATTTPVVGYKDDLAQFPWPNPITLEADGRIPLIVFIMASDAATPGTLTEIRRSVRMRLLDKSGVLQFDYTSVPLMTSDPGESSGGGGPDPTPVDPLGLMTTGMMMAKYGVGKIPGFVRANGLTIGNPTSGATELQGADAQALYLYLYNADPNLVVLGGRSGDALIDFQGGVSPTGGTGKQMVLPDFSGCALGFLDNMSGTPRGILTAASFNALVPGWNSLLPTALGAKTGLETYKLLEAEIPLHKHPAYIDDPEHTHTSNAIRLPAGSPVNASGGSQSLATAVIDKAATGVKIKSANTATGVGIDNQTGNQSQGGQNHLNLQPVKLVTAYIRL